MHAPENYGLPLAMVILSVYRVRPSVRPTRTAHPYGVAGSGDDAH